MCRVHATTSPSNHDLFDDNFNLDRFSTIFGALKCMQVHMEKFEHNLDTIELGMNKLEHRIDNMELLTK
uniref:Uncharacterized protein n=1 Tax=Physcomitrium patens TaxID=3218 RepID=A0A2K1KLD3_PHYPA|nr:hypothetical protein PHYPA_008265 [Physcomitrium patens]